MTGGACPRLRERLETPLQGESPGGPWWTKVHLCTHGVLAAELRGGTGEPTEKTADRAAILATLRPTEETFASMGSTTI